jgi:DNA-binding Lrp family transcriptional regulator
LKALSFGRLNLNGKAYFGKFLICPKSKAEYNQIPGGNVVEAYVLVKIASQTELCGQYRSTVDKIKKMKGVKDVQLLFGDFDAIVKLDMPKIHDVENMVMEDLCMIEGVESTLTLLCVDERILK